MEQENRNNRRSRQRRNTASDNNAPLRAVTDGHFNKRPPVDLSEFRPPVMKSEQSGKKAEANSVSLELVQEKKPTQSNAGTKLAIPLGVGIVLVFSVVGLAIAISVFDVSDSPSGHFGDGELLGGTNSYIPSNDGIGSLISEVWDILQGAGRSFTGGIGSLGERIQEGIMESRRGAGDTSGSRGREQKQFDDAVKEVEAGIGRRLSDDERTEFHRAISEQGYGFWQMVYVGLELFGGDVNRVPRDKWPEWAQDNG